MKEKEISKLYNSITNVDNQFIEMAQSKLKKKKNSSLKWGAMAACLCFVIAGAAVLSQRNLSTPGTGDGGVVEGGNNEGIMYSVAVYPATESKENVVSANVTSLTENEALTNSLANHLPKQLPDGFHYGSGSLYHTVMKDGAQYNMLRVEYVSGEIPEQQFSEDGGAIAPEAFGEVFIVCVMNYEPDINGNIYSSTEEVTLSLLEESESASILTGEYCVSVFIDTAEPTAVLEALKTID